ncbi:MULTISPECIES: YoaK family protein [Rhodococcus]|uniref:YoaK family protein n=1 Tax=Rhodococcus TaxID=1827 RepID=UPI001F408EAA|nr:MULTISPECIES: YoaK family protein [Rhodococcus]
MSITDTTTSSTDPNDSASLPIGRTAWTVSHQYLQLWLMMVLTFVTGLLDAVGYLGLDRIFTGNMTGNIVILGMGVAGEDSLPVVGPLLALAAFMLGAALSGLVLRRCSPGWSSPVTMVLSVGVVVLVAAGTALLVFPVEGNSTLGVAIACIIAVQMGAQACTARFLAVKDMTTVVVTSTITALAGESFLHKGFARLVNRRLWAVLLIFAGAVTGALLMKTHIAIPVYLAAMLTAATVIIGHLRWQHASG